MILKEEYKTLSRQPENFLSRVNHALNRPIQSRCAELAVLFDRGSIKDLHTVFPLLIDSIFGPHGTACWDLRSVMSTVNHQDFQALQYFLSPLGPLFKVIYTLLRDSQLKFDFSLSYLPAKVYQSLDGITMHPFYVDLIHVDQQTNQIDSLMLNPFDYYFFHFAYHLINPFHQRISVPGCATWSTVYYVLCCDYVIHFLPSACNSAILPVLNFYNGKNPVYMLPLYNRITKVPRLFRAETLNVNKAQTLEHHPRNEIWRSETIMTIFIDMWLTNDQVLNGYQSFNTPPQTALYKHNLILNELPTGEYIRIIRILIKQLHAFSASAKTDESHMGELKKIVIPYLQGRIYVFLRHMVHRWPLDGSFRLVLELWVSFIQPWRYPANEFMKTTQEVNPDVEDINIAPMKAVDREYMQFMAENLLAYTVLLQQLLPRFTKVDLSSPKISLIFYRLTKVFAQPNLVTYLREIENCAENINTSPLHSYNSNVSYGLPPLSPTSKWSTNASKNYNSTYTTDQQINAWHQNTKNNSTFETRKPLRKWDNLIKQKILELEGSNFCYKPIFCTTPAAEVSDLITHIQNAEKIAQAVVDSRLAQIKQHTKGVFGFFKYLFSVTDFANDEFTLEERRKVPTYLAHSLTNLMEIFNIQEITDTNLYQTANVTPSFSVQQDVSLLYTPTRAKELAKTIKYEGNPDLSPIRSDEIKVLVRLLYQLSLKINEDFGCQINVLYQKENFLGRLARQIISPPLRIYKYEKSFSGSPRVPEQLPPRVSFRYFGSQKVAFYTIFSIILSKLCGYGYLTFLYIYFLLWFFYIFLKACCDSRQVSVNAMVNENANDIDSLSSNSSTSFSQVN